MPYRRPAAHGGAFEHRCQEFSLDIPTPFNIIVKTVKWIWQRVTKVLLYKTYTASHRKWVARHRLGAQWHHLGAHLEYSVRLAQPTDPEPQISRLALRSTGESLAKVDLYFEALGAGNRYQEKISVCGVDHRPIVCSLKSIPVQAFVGGQNRGIAFSVEHVQLRQCVVQRSSGEVLPARDSAIFTMSHSWIMHDEWARGWGRWWNCNAIKFAKGELAVYWRFAFGLPQYRVYSPYASYSRYKFGLSPVLQGFGWIMAQPLLVTVQFWLAIWSGLCVMDKDDKLRFRWNANKAASEQQEDLA